MKVHILILCAVALVQASPTLLRHSEFQDFKLAHEKTYISEEEEKQRLEVFSNNLEKIEKHNDLYARGLTSYYMGVTQFTDMTHEEFVAFLNMQGPPPQLSNATLFSLAAKKKVPTTRDWRKGNIVTPVKNQGSCGSCWTFSTTGALEGAYALSNYRLVSLSEQYLLDCDTAQNGCKGGAMVLAFEFIIKNGGIATEADYPYKAKRGNCNRNKLKAVKIRKYVEVPEGDEEKLRQAVGTEGPVCAGVDASHFQNYHGGVFHDAACNAKKVDHGVLVVGYGREQGKDYWLIKNSWGSEWGEEGYIKLARNRNNHCGVTNMCSYPVV